MMNLALISEVSKELCIFKEAYEDSSAWCHRVKYSLLGLQILSALYDKYDDFDDDEIISDSVSRQHISSRANKLAEILGISQDDCEHIMNLYVRTGFILNKRNRLTYPSVTMARIETCFVARGIHPSNAIGVSGLGLIVKPAATNEINIDELFNLSCVDIMQWHEMFIKSLRDKWERYEELSDVEYFNPKLKPWEMWSDVLPKNEIILCRDKDLAGRKYRVISIKSGISKIATLPFIGKGEYRRLEISLRILANNRPTVRVKKHENAAIFEYNYRLPPSEQNFIDLYSWDNKMRSVNFKIPFSRIVAIELYQIFLSVFIRLGYAIEEE